MRFILLLFIITTVISCSNKMEGTEKPDDLIPRDSMVVVLKEMTLIESHIQTKYSHVSVFQKTMKLSGKKVLDKYHISFKRYDQSMSYYGSRQDQMTAIYSEILDSLTRQASMFDKEILLKDSSIQKVQPKGILSRRNLIH